MTKTAAKVKEDENNLLERDMQLNQVAELRLLLGSGYITDENYTSDSIAKPAFDEIERGEIKDILFSIIRKWK